MNQINISIITPVFNRKNILSKSIDSSLQAIRIGFAEELIVVDDASTDGSLDYIKKKYCNEIERGALKLIELENNLGVTGAKNIGAFSANGDFLLFLDSDDALNIELTEKVFGKLSKYSHKYELFFFRCIDLDTGLLIGPDAPSTELSFLHLLNYGTPGECLPIVSRKLFQEHPYYESLRGCESLTYLEMLDSGCRAYLSNIPARIYSYECGNRLSTRKNLYIRSDKILSYYIMRMRYRKSMTLKVMSVSILKIIYYTTLSSMKKLFRH